MPSVPNVPLAWRNLAHDRVRFALFASGIGFAVVLMGVQLGIMNGMLDGNTVLLKRLNADIILVNPNKQSLLFLEGVSRRRLEQAAAVPGVASVHPMFIDYQMGTMLHTAEPEHRAHTRRVRVIGIDPTANLLTLPEVDDATWAKLNTPGTALFDEESRPNPFPKLYPGKYAFGDLDKGTHSELSKADITLIGSFKLGFDFSSDGTLVVNERTYSKHIREPITAPFAEPLADADLGLVKVKPGSHAPTVKAEIAAALGLPGNPGSGSWWSGVFGGSTPDRSGDVEVLTKDEMIARERGFWQRNTPIGFAFGAGVVLGFVVGMVICYQILASDVADHLAEYATLKAIGYPNRYLNLIVLQEAMYLAVAGFIPGILVTYGVYVFLRNLTGMPLELTPQRFLLVLGLTMIMCVLSGLMALSKVKKVDPADVF